MGIIRISWEVIFQKAILHNFLNLTIAKGHGLVVKICTVHHNYRGYRIVSQGRECLQQTAQSQFWQGLTVVREKLLASEESLIDAWLGLRLVFTSENQHYISISISISTNIRTLYTGENQHNISTSTSLVCMPTLHNRLPLCPNLGLEMSILIGLPLLLCHAGFH